MHLVVYLHMACPIHQAGSETTVHAAMRAMVARGHSVTVLADRLTPENISAMAARGMEGFLRLNSDSYDYDGVKVRCIPINNQQAHVREFARDADLLITHLDVTSLAMSLAIDLQKPLVHFVHNDAQLKYWHVDPRVEYKASLIVFNSHWVARKERFQDQPWSGDYIVLHPIVEPERYRCKPGTKIALCNPTDGKGISTLHKLAEAMPDYEFLVVEGIYGEQIAPPNLGIEWELAHPNIEHMKNDPDFRNVLMKTKVLLMPSNYESFGRCAVEAACAGIPSIVHPTLGLLESLRAERIPTEKELKGGWVSGAGIFCDRADIDSWKAQLERLYSDEIYYRSRSDAALKLADSLDPESEFDRLEEALVRTFEKSRSKESGKMAMWISDRWIYRMADGSYKAMDNPGRIPPGAVSMFAGKGTEIPEDVAKANGWIGPDAKAQEAPQENKAIEAPAENKELVSSAKIPRKRKAS